MGLFSSIGNATVRRGAAQDEEEYMCNTCTFWAKDSGGFSGSDQKLNMQSGEQVVIGECRRHPPILSVSTELKDVDKIKSLLDREEELGEKFYAELYALEKDLKTAEADLAASKDDHERAEAEKRVRRAEEALKEFGPTDWQEAFYRMVPSENQAMGKWIKTKEDDWCGEYKNKWSKDNA